MDREQIMQVIRELAMSQGMYGRILRQIEDMRENDPDGYEELMTTLEEQKFGDAVDLVMYLET